jgi:hypothetical protein
MLIIPNPKPAAKFNWKILNNRKGFNSSSIFNFVSIFVPFSTNLIKLHPKALTKIYFPVF